MQHENFTAEHAEITEKGLSFLSRDFLNKMPSLCVLCGYIIIFSSAFGVEKRGFIAEDEEGRLFLVERPNLKSCCVGKEMKGIELIGDYSEYSRFGAVTVSGDLIETSDGQKLVKEASQDR